MRFKNVFFCFFFFFCQPQRSSFLILYFVLVKKKSYRKKKKFYVTVIWTWWRPISHAQNKRSQIILLKHSDISWPLLIAQWITRCGKSLIQLSPLRQHLITNVNTMKYYLIVLTQRRFTIA